MGPVHCIRRFLVDLFGHVLMQVVAGSPRHPCFIEISRAREKIWNPPREGPAIIKKKAAVSESVVLYLYTCLNIDHGDATLHPTILTLDAASRTPQLTCFDL